MSGESTETNWYDFLGLLPGASEEEIRRAYYTLVRRYPPRKFPEDFQRITRAYYTLGDTRRRAEYDQSRTNGRRVQVLVDQAALAAEKDPQKAMMLLKSAVTIAPDMPRPRALLAHVLMRIEEFTVAERQYRWLIRYAPSDETIQLRLARCLHRQGRLEDAEAETKSVLRRNPGYHDAITLLSELYSESLQQQNEAETLERAIQNDGKVNWADFDALMKLLLIRLRQGNAEGIELASERLRSVISPEHALEAVQRLSALGEQLKDDGQIGLTSILLQEAARISLPEADAEQAQDLPKLRLKMERIGEARSLVCDTLVRGGLQMLVQALYLEETKAAIRQSRMQAALDKIKQEIEAEARAFVQRLEYIRREYPRIGEEQEAVFDQLRRRAEARIEQLAQEIAQRPAPPPTTEANAPRRGNLFERLLGH